MEPPEGSEETSWNVFGGLCVATSILDSKKHEKFLPLGPHKLRFSRHGSSIQRASLIPPRQERQATQRSSAIFFFCSAFYLSVFGFCVNFGAILVPFWLHFERRVVPRDTLEPLCVAPMPQDHPTCDFGIILGAPWDPFWHPFWNSFRLWTCSGHPRGAFWQHFWCIW